MENGARTYFEEDSCVARRTLPVPTAANLMQNQQKISPDANVATAQNENERSFRGSTPLHIAAEAADESLMTFLLKLFDIDRDGWSLHRC